jgi:hypothetical protein
MRVAVADIDIGGQHIRSGDGILIGAAAANHDPGFVERPDDLDVDHPARHHLGPPASPDPGPADIARRPSPAPSSVKLVEVSRRHRRAASATRASSHQASASTGSDHGHMVAHGDPSTAIRP